MADLVLVGKGWKARALLRAQLLEDGVKVEAYESLEDARGSLGYSMPTLLVADLTASHYTAADIRQLAIWATSVPTWIIGSRSERIWSDPITSSFERIFLLPVDVGKLTSLIEQRIRE